MQGYQKSTIKRGGKKVAPHRTYLVRDIFSPTGYREVKWPVKVVEPNKKRLGIPPSLREDVLKRDHYRCSMCGYRFLEVHHIDGNPSNDQLENLATLCQSCHLKAHGKDFTRPLQDLASKLSEIIREVLIKADLMRIRIPRKITVFLHEKTAEIKMPMTDDDLKKIKELMIKRIVDSTWYKLWQPVFYREMKKWVDSSDLEPELKNTLNKSLENFRGNISKYKYVNKTRG